MSRIAAAPAPHRIPRRTVAPAPVGDRPQLRLVDPDARRREVRRRWLVRLWAVGIVAAALLGVMVHAFMAEAQMRVGQVGDEMVTEQQRYEEARLRVAQLSSPAEIVGQATRLGLHPAATARPVPVAGVNGTRKHPATDSTSPWEAAKRALDTEP